MNVKRLYFFIAGGFFCIPLGIGAMDQGSTGNGTFPFKTREVQSVQAVQAAEEEKYPEKQAVQVEPFSLEGQLQQALHAKRYYVVMKLIIQGANPHAGTPSAIDIARELGRIDIVESMSVLFDKTPPPLTPEQCKEQLHQAALDGNTDFIDTLYKRYHKNIKVNTVAFPLVNSDFNIVNTLNEKEETPVFMAVQAGHIAFVDKLIDAFPVAGAGLYHKNKEGQTAVRLLIDLDKDIEVAQPTQYSPALLMQLCRNEQHKDSCTVLNLLKRLFPVSINKEFIAPGTYKGREIFNLFLGPKLLQSHIL
ncbi:MAG: hypothetical protein NT124_00100 [Candidatus Dependentiae bacterium]|nr:hypothetical protein [Candidatus Dependentiae bacterium]